jgi:hypothetical protein
MTAEVGESMIPGKIVAGVVAGMAALALSGLHPAAADVITLHCAVQFNDDHAFNRTLLKFEELTKK